jgi:prepilin-type processing-associated H-X9-DG protein
VELLIVIGIIALLIGLLLPALGAAQEQAKRVQCLSNLRQLATAAQNYAALQKGCYPSAYYNATNPPLVYAYFWDFTLVLDQSNNTRSIQPGLLWLGQTNPRIQQCPSFDGRSNTLMDPFTGYNYNTSYIGRDEPQPPAKVTDVRRPSTTALFGDGQWSNGANKYMRAPRPVTGGLFVAPTAGTQGFRHRKQTNVAFCDGHAESLRDRFTAGANVAPQTGFLSDDNSRYRLGDAD